MQSRIQKNTLNNIAIIGSDSFIASKLYESISTQFCVQLFSRESSNKRNEIIKELFEISLEDFININVVINFAAIVHQPKLKNDKLYKKVNTELPIHLATNAKKAGVKHFIQMSTIAVYGNTTEININSIERPNNIYGLSKFNADKQLISLQDENFKVSIIRPSMVYGGGIAPGNLLNLIKTSEKGIPMPFKGIKNKRDFINVNNLVHSIKAIIENNITGIIIPTDKEPISTEQILFLIKKYSSKKIRIFKIPKLLMVLIKVIRPNLYKKVFGNLKIDCNLPVKLYTPKFTFEDGIKEMIEKLNIRL